MKKYSAYFIVIIMALILSVGCSSLTNSNITVSPPTSKPTNSPIPTQETPAIEEYFLSVTGMNSTQNQTIYIGRPISSLWVPELTDEDRQTLEIFSDELNNIAGKKVMPNHTSITKSYQKGDDILYFWPGIELKSEQQINRFHTDYANMLKDQTDEEFYSVTTWIFVKEPQFETKYIIFKAGPNNLPITIFVNSDLVGEDRERTIKYAILSYFGIQKMISMPLNETDKTAIKILFSDKIKDGMTSKEIHNTFLLNN